jgi:hypothetical protein
MYFLLVNVLMAGVIVLRSFFVTIESFKNLKKFKANMFNALGLKLLREHYRPERLVNKIAFFAACIEHFEALFSLLNNDEYVFIIIHKNEEQERRLRAKNAGIYTIAECLEQKIYFKLLVIDVCVPVYYFPFMDSSKLINFIAEKKLQLITNIFAYIRHKTYNSLFDYVICNGEYYKTRLEANKIPRQKIYCYGSIRRNELVVQPAEEQKKEFWLKYGGDAGKKTVLWVIAHSYGSSIYSHCETLAVLGGRYNIVLQPNPTLQLEFPDYEDFIHSKLPRCIVIKNINSLKLIPYADFVICDYGGSPLTALMADANIALFNMYPPFDIRVAFGPFLGNCDAYLRKHIINFNPNEGEKLLAALEDESVWERQKAVRKKLIAEFFTGNPNAAEDTVNLMRRVMRGEE